MIVAPWCLTPDLNGLLHTQEEESHSWWRWPTPRSVPGCQRTSTRTTWFTVGPVRNMLSAPRGVASASMWLGSSYEPSLNVWVDGLTIFQTTNVDNLDPSCGFASPCLVLDCRLMISWLRRLLPQHEAPLHSAALRSRWSQGVRNASAKGNRIRESLMLRRLPMTRVYLIRS